MLGTPISGRKKTGANAKLKEEKFIKDISVFGNWMHGTHVTGIAAKFSTEAKLIGAKLIPTEVKLPGQKSADLVITTGANKTVINTSEKGGVKDYLIMQALAALAKQQSVVYGEIGGYLKGAKADVMNGSFGTGYTQIQGVITQLYVSIFKKEPTAVELKKYTDAFFASAVKETEAFTKAASSNSFRICCR